LGHFEDLHKQASKLIEKSPAKGGQGVVVGVGVGRDEAKGY
jgi:hypothetical protein